MIARRLVFVLGLGCLIGGMQIHPLVSVLGFVIMLGATVIAVTSWQHVGLEADGQHPGGKGKGSDRDFMDKMEERWRRRQDEGL